jgi:NitT/TauT family transport system substrate-binding protein
MKTTRRDFLAAAAMMGLAPIGPLVRPALAQTPEKLTDVTVRLAFTYNGHRSPYLLAVDKGFYRAAGLNVQVLEGKGVTSSMQLVAAKEDTFTIVDPPSLMLGVAQGMRIKQVAQLYQSSPNALISWKEAPVATPADLAGKSVATLQGDTTTTMLYALLAKNKVDRDAVHIVASDGGTRNQTFLAKRTQAITGFINDSYLGLQALTDNALQCFPYSAFGIDTMGDGIAAHADTISASPDVVKGFVQASIRGYAYALAHPEEAIASLIKKSPALKPDVELAKLKATAPLLNAPGGAKHPLGFSDKARWEDAQALMNAYGGLSKTEADVSVFYTNQFLA